MAVASGLAPALSLAPSLPSVAVDGLFCHLSVQVLHCAISSLPSFFPRDGSPLPPFLHAARFPPAPTVGIEADAAQVKKLVSELEGKDLAEVIAAGRKNLQSVAAAAPAGAAAPAAGGAAAPAAAAAPEPESEEEEMELDLFG